MDVDLLIAGGRVIDGTGRPGYRADVTIKDGRIVDIGNIAATAGVPTLNASGLAVTPGFIDVHSHSDFTLTVDPRAVSSVTQGVTLEVVGNCGHGCAPIVDPDIAKMNIYGYHSDYPMHWRTMAEYFEALEACKPAVNVMTLVPNGNLRLATVGLADRPATKDELEKMRRMLEQSLEEGASGFSTGLEYGTEIGCTEEEITELCRVVAKAGGIYATHTRNEYGRARETIEEAIRTSQAANVALQISHIAVAARLMEDPRPAVEQSIVQVEQAKARGVDIGFDMHTRGYGITNLSAILPPWIMEGGQKALERRLADPLVRKELKAYPNIIVAEARGRWDKILVFECKAAPELSQRSIGEISAGRGVEPLDAIYDILLTEIERIHEVMVVELIYDQSDLQLPFEHADCMVGSDATALATDGPLQGRCFHGAYTWAAWFFRHYTRETKTLAPESAIRRLTSLPAERFGIKDRGILRKGAWADVAIFDPLRFGERGTIFAPNQVAEGMMHVLVNGTVTLKDGQFTGERNGQVIRR
jgi:N-acyl-D-aspartate/D-glutamate deacylase